MHVHGGTLDINMDLIIFLMGRTSFRVSFAECITAAGEMQVGFLV